jgi:regulator of protease activity HflC (stomatin/prohibitin superfamily)
MTYIIILGLIALAGVVAAGFAPLTRGQRIAGVAATALIVVVGCVASSSVTIPADQEGIVLRLIGQPLPAGNIVARHGEQGPQAEILGPGFHVGYWPGMFEVDMAPVMVIERGKVGVVTALDGAPLASGETWAAAWTDPAAMLDARTFLDKGGQRGPQLTVLPPGAWRYNPRLFSITAIDCLVVAPGTVAVIKANTGRAPGVDAVTTVNGVPLVAEGERGVWRAALPPGAYNLNTFAYMPTVVKTSQRVYTYQTVTTHPAATAATLGDWSVTVRSQDGFSFPVDVRVSCAVEARDAPFLVALLGNPDLVVKDDQEDEDLEILEGKVVLPAVRAIFRNVAEGMGALAFVNARSQIERDASVQMREALAVFHLTCSGVYVGNIHLDASEAGRQLIATQTDREVAVTQQALYGEQRKAQEARATLVKAQEDAEQQRYLAQATYAVQLAEQHALAQEAQARGESEYSVITGEGRAKAYDAMAKILGRDQVARLEALRLAAEGHVQITPQVLVTDAGGALDALAGTLLRQGTTATGAAQ